MARATLVDLATALGRTGPACLTAAPGDLHHPDPQTGQPQARQPFPASGDCPAPPQH